MVQGIRSAVWSAAIVVALTVSASAQRIVPLATPTNTTERLAIALRALGSDARVLYVTAHPDDEDNATLAWLNFGRGAKTTLLTLTRGEGGQNSIGPELFDSLAVLRMGELEANRRFDGAQQRFGPFIDFGFSFSEEETFEKWGKTDALRCVVAALRRARPQVILTMPARWPGGGRHHQASAQLAQEAFDVAATDQWPELGAPYAADRLFEQVWTTVGQDGAALFEVPVTTFDPVLGTSYEELGFRARSQHKCQSMAQVWPPDTPRRRNVWKLVRNRSEVPSPRPTQDVLYGLNRLSPLFASALEPAAVYREVLSKVANISGDGEDAEFSDVAWLASGVELFARTDRGVVSPGESLNVSAFLTNRAPKDRVVRVSLGVFATLDPKPLFEGLLTSGQRLVAKRTVTLAVDQAPGPVTTLPRVPGFDRYVAREDLPPVSALTLKVELLDKEGGRVLAQHTLPVLHHFEDPTFPMEREEGVVCLPSVSAIVDPPLVVTPTGDTIATTVNVRLTRRTAIVGRFEVVVLGGDRERLLASVVSGPDDPEVTNVRVSVPSEISDGAELRVRWVPAAGPSQWLKRAREVRYPHIQRRFLLDDAVAPIVRVKVTFDAGARVGYVEGLGDRVLPALRSLDSRVTVLDDAALRTADFSALDVVVLGVRAYQRPILWRATPALFEWVRAGGHLVVQYQRPDDIARAPSGFRFAPMDAVITTKRVTVEESPVSIRIPTHRFFHHPNLITQGDFEGWVQERGVYFLEPKDPSYEALLSLRDPWPANHEEQTGSLVTVVLGKGTWTYTGLALFRQLPRGVPGAWRLFANLIARPKE